MCEKLIRIDGGTREKLFARHRSNSGNLVAQVGSCQFYGRLNCAANNGEKVDRGSVSLENLRCRRRLYIYIYLMCILLVYKRWD